MRTLFVVLITVALGASPAAAETRWVDAAGNTPFAEIQDAIDASADGDVVLVFPGVYGPVDFDGKTITVRSIEGAGVTTIDGGGLGPAVTIDETGPELLLHGFTVVGGTGFYEESVLELAGGGILVNRDAEGRVSGNVVTGNTADVGGGLGVIASSPEVYGNTFFANTAAGPGGGIWIQGAAAAPVTFVCNDVLENEGGSVGGMFVGASVVEATNLVFDANVGERGGLWVTLEADGFLHNATYVSNESTAGGAAGLEAESATFAFSGNLVAFNEDGWGVIRSDATAPWSYNDVVSNDLGEYSGAAGDPTGIDGNVAIPPSFVLFTPDAGDDDDLALTAGSALLDLGDPSLDLLDLDDSRNAIGFEGGPHAACDLDGDGVRPDEGDCRPDEGDFHPDAYELEDGRDTDCDGYGTAALYELVADDGGLAGAGTWTFAAPDALPGVGYQGTSAWCTGCTGPALGGSLTLDLDLTAISAGVAVRVLLVHAYDDGSDAGWSFEVGFEDATGSEIAGEAFTGAQTSWDFADVDVPAALVGSTGTLLLDAVSSGSPAPGWTIGRVAIQVEDADGDGRSADLADCDDDDPTVYDDAPEVPYDGLDQDCDGADLTDADGDGFDGAEADGDDCDDDDATVFPGAEEIAYDGIDQDCAGGDLNDLDEDGSVGSEAGGPDCDDDDETIHPGAEEIPYDGVDQDCDEADLTDVDGDGHHGNIDPPFGDCDDTDATVHPDADEVCDDGVDNNCDGATDVLPDGDGDGVDVCAGDCDDADATVAPGFDEACDGLDTDCDGDVPADEIDADLDGSLLCGGDCDDSDPTSGAGFPEVCDAADNDCDGSVDEGHDLDGDGFSACADDCDDQRSSVFPGAEVVCDDNLDHDCDGTRDFEQDVCTGGCGGCEEAEASLAGGRGGAGVLLLAIALGGTGRRRRRV